MKPIKAVRITKKDFLYLQSRQILSTFKKAVLKLKSGDYTGVDFKKREPKTHNIWPFRINKKYRAWATKENDILIIYKIDDHQ